MAERQITITARYDDDEPYAEFVQDLMHAGFYDVDWEDDQEVEVAPVGQPQVKRLKKRR